MNALVLIMTYEWTLTIRKRQEALLSVSVISKCFLGKQTKIVPLCTFATYHNCFIFWHNSLEIIPTTLVYRGWMKHEAKTFGTYFGSGIGQCPRVPWPWPRSQWGCNDNFGIYRVGVRSLIHGRPMQILHVRTLFRAQKFTSAQFDHICYVCFRPSGDLVCWNDENPGCNADLSGIKQTVDSPDWNTLCKVPSDHRYIVERKSTTYYPFTK